MLNLIKFKNNNKKYIFKKGKFSVEPSINEFTLDENGYLHRINQGRFLRIPYNKPGEMFYIKFRINDNDSDNIYISNNLDPFTEVYITSTNYNKNRDIVVGLQTEEMIQFSVGYSTVNLECWIKEIWVEKNETPGTVVARARASLKRFKAHFKNILKGGGNHA